MRERAWGTSSLLLLLRASTTSAVQVNEAPCVPRGSPVQPRPPHKDAINTDCIGSGVMGSSDLPPSPALKKGSKAMPSPGPQRTGQDMRLRMHTAVAISFRRDLERSTNTASSHQPTITTWCPRSWTETVRTILITRQRCATRPVCNSIPQMSRIFVWEEIGGGRHARIEGHGDDQRLAACGHESSLRQTLSAAGVVISRSDSGINRRTVRASEDQSPRGRMRARDGVLPPRLTCFLAR